MSATKRSGGTWAFPAATSASPGNAPVPPSSESRSSASAEYPLAARRPATVRMCSFSPRFSWMTRTPPRGLAAAVHAASNGPRGPANMIDSRATGASSSPTRRALRLGRRRLRPAARSPLCRHPEQADMPYRLMPSAGSSATSSAGYCWISVMAPPRNDMRTDVGISSIKPPKAASRQVRHLRRPPMPDAGCQPLETQVRRMVSLTCSRPGAPEPIIVSSAPTRASAPLANRSQVRVSVMTWMRGTG